MKREKRAVLTLDDACWCRISGDWPKTAVREATSYQHPRAFVSRAYRQGFWDGRVHYMKGDLFPAGLLSIVKKTLKEKGVKVKVRDNTPEPGLKVRSARGMVMANGRELRKYQSRAVDEALKHRRGVVKMATGGGKTISMAALIRCLRTKSKLPRSLVIVPNRNLLKQTVAELAAFLGEPVGVVGGGVWAEERVTVAIPASLTSKKNSAKRVDLINSLDVLVLDECHHGSSTQWTKAVANCPASYRFAFSGTPLDRSDGANLGVIGLTGKLLADIDAQSLVKQGFLALPNVKMVKVSRPKIQGHGLKYADVYDLGIVRNRRFHEKLVKHAARYAAEGKNVLVLVTRLEHGANLQEVFDEAGFPVPTFVHGKTPQAELQEVIRNFRAGDVPILIASPIFGEGTDLPSVDVVVLADGGKAVIKTVQKMGRAMRPKKGKANECVVLDFFHKTHDWLTKHSKARRAVYRREGFPVTLVRK